MSKPATEETNIFLCSYCGQMKKTRYYSTCSSEACLNQWMAEKKADNEVALKDPRVAAIRADAAVGSGSCSSVDECYEHSELLAALLGNEIKSPYDAVVWAREKDGLHWESGLNQMSGEKETDDPIREMYEESKTRNALPILASREERSDSERSEPPMEER